MDRIEYCYPDTNILKNKLGIKDSGKLHEMERGLTFFRLAQLEKEPIPGRFDLQHLQKIHHHIFQDMYGWAGQIRLTNIAKGNSLFALYHLIEPSCDELFKALKKDNYLQGLSLDKVSERLAHYTSEINAIHPFREGNGRATREFIRCLAKEAGYELNYSEFDKNQLVGAYIASFKGDNTELNNLYKENLRQIIPELERDSFIEENKSVVVIEEYREMDDEWELEP
ncbi:protein involved in cell division [Desulfitobacterium dehalogenans ATCC 51507]|uniref:protein adenylyltransferase n=1 Tax=Desulfitobacterium dehalogenans (strain ATCC 51507 / DSM 9161 / JW/IU-DC1) TaxID=756499 RepID=I4AC02_DESDJ|nr:Fic family protein [Desulfitobacterium dehalogenans]AFM01487.1 protein involved in cell division [Desulfitobacterium dehalogenans ATCC 51507]